MTTTLISRQTSTNAHGDVAIVTAATIVGGDHPLTADELAHACGTHIEWIAQLVDAGIVRATSEAPHSQWRFHGEDLANALEVRRLQRDFDVGMDAAALMLDMQGEIRRLKRQLQLQLHGVI